MIQSHTLGKSYCIIITYCSRNICKLSHMDNNEVQVWKIQVFLLIKSKGLLKSTLLRLYVNEKFEGNLILVKTQVKS